jgi:electron transport complex protein RnfB
MMEVYEQLRQQLDKHPSGAPPAPEIIEILSELFTEDEAKVASFTPFLPQAAAVIGGYASMSAEDAGRLLESLADKGLIFAREKNGDGGTRSCPSCPASSSSPT